MDISQPEVEQFLYREARMLDDRDFEGWLECYAPDSEFWMPAWDDDDKIVEDPQREISLIYYGSKQGLEDRVFRIRTERSSATSLPEPRTGHTITASPARPAVSSCGPVPTSTANNIPHSEPPAMRPELNSVPALTSDSCGAPVFRST